MDKAAATSSANGLAYYASDRSDLAMLLPKGPTRLLDIGCGTGETWRARRKELGLEVWGVEIVPEAASAAGQNLDRVVQGDAEAVVAGQALPERYFDAAFMADVLEHLRDPWEFLKRSRHLLKGESSYLLVSIPNIRHYRVLKRLILRGRFRYQDDGILDRTHLRFFCRRDVEDMLEDAGFEVITLKRRLMGSALARALNTLSFGLFDDFLAEQYHILARPARPARK